MRIQRATTVTTIHVVFCCVLLFGTLLTWKLSWLVSSLILINSAFLFPNIFILSLMFLQALEDEMETSSESRSRSSTGLSSPLSLPMVRIEVTSPQPNDAQAHSEEPPPRIAADIDRAFMLLDFPDVIKSAESSPRHSLIPLTEFYEHGRNLNQRRTREIINQINAEVAQAISRGQSPYFIYGITDNDEETWCWNSTQTSLEFLGFKKLLCLWPWLNGITNSMESHQKEEDYNGKKAEIESIPEFD